MANVLDVADYFLLRVDRDSGDAITHLKLQKLVYYAQAWSLVFRGESLFPNEIQAWKHGPVVAEVWTEYANYGNTTIPEPPEPDKTYDKFSNDELRVLDLVWDTYGELSASKLRKLTHEELPWQLARRGMPDDANSKEPVLQEDMKSYYTDFVEIDNHQPVGISSKATIINKEGESGKVIPLTDRNGKIQWVKADELKEYFESKGEGRRFIKREPRRKFADL